MTLEEWDKKLLTPEQDKLRRRLRWLAPLQAVAEAIGLILSSVLIIAVVYVFAAVFS